MHLNDLTLEVRDRDLKRVGQITAPFLNLKATVRWCAVGEWALTLPGTHPMVAHLATPGSGVILLGPDGESTGTIFSGPTATPKRKRDARNPDGTYTFAGVTDEIHLLDALAFPSPLVADPAAQTKANDVRSGKTEALLRQYVAYNIAGSHAPAGRLRGIRPKIRLGGADGGRGITATKSPRFQNLLELLREIVLLDPSIGFRMVQVDEYIEFTIVEARDRRAFVRFDIDNGTLTSEEVQQGGPGLTDAIVAGQGEGAERQIVRRQTPYAIASEASWGRVIEDFIDQRNTDDTLELQQSGDEALAEAEGGTSVKIIPADDSTMQYGIDWRPGDLVTIVVDGAEAESAVTETAILANPDGVRAGAAIGDVSSHTAGDTLGAKVDAIDTRVALLERAGLNEARQVTDWNDATSTGFVWGNGAANAPAAGVVMGRVMRDSTRIVQEAPDPSNLIGRTWRRVFSGGVWGAWKLVGAGGLPDPQSVQGPSVQAITATSFAAVPNFPTISLTLPEPAWVRVEYGAWMQGTGGDLRAGAALSGATVQDANNAYGGGGSWGVVLWANGVYEQRFASKIVRFEAGTTVVTMFAYKTGSTVQQVNYGTLAVIPERWA